MSSGSPDRGRPPEGTLAGAEQGADVGGNEAGVVEGVLHPLLESGLADVVAVVQRGHPAGVEVEHRPDLDRHRLPGRRDHRFRRPRPRLHRALQRPARREVAVERIVGGGLVGDHVGPDPAPHQLRVHLGRIPEQPHRYGTPVAAGRIDARQGLVEVVAALIQVARLQSPPDPPRVALDREQRRARHGGGEGLRAAHAPEPRGEDPAPREAAAIMPARHRDEGLVGALDDPLAADVDPGAGGHLPVHH